MKKNLIILWILCLANTLFAQFTVDIQVSDPPKCTGTATGVLTAAITGGTAPYIFLWSTGETSQVISNKSAGTYTVTVSDAMGIVVSDTKVLVSVPGPQANPLIIPADHLGDGSGGNNGEIHLNITSGTGPYMSIVQYWIYPPMDSARAQGTLRGSDAFVAYYLGVDSTNTKYYGNDLSGLRPGNYKVHINDANGCSTDTIITVDNLHPLLANEAKDTVDCYFAERGASGWGHIYNEGTSPYAHVYSENPSDTTWIYEASFTDGAGIFHHVDTMQNGRMVVDQDTAIVFQNGYPSWYTGPRGFDVNPTRIFANQRLQGFFWDKMIDANGYEVIHYGTQTYPLTQLSATITQDSIVCFGGTAKSVTIYPQGSYNDKIYTYRWTDGEKTATINNKPARVYNCTVADWHGCSVKFTFNVTEPPQIKMKANLERPVDCFGNESAKINLGVSGGTGSLTCETAQSLNGPIEFTGQILDSLSGGMYYTIVTDTKNCVLRDSFKIEEPKKLEVFVDNTTPVTCFGLMTGTAQLHHLGGTEPVTGQILKDGQFFDGYRGFIYNLPEGNYQIKLNDAHACPDTGSFVITQPAKIVTSTMIENAPCYADSGNIIIKATGGTKKFHLDPDITGILFNDTTTFIVHLPKGDYKKIVIDDTTGCRTEISASITQPEPLRGEVKQLSEVKCPGDATASVNQTTWGGTFPYSYLWSNGSTSEDLINIEAGIYYFTLTDFNQCIRKDSIEIMEPDSLTIDIDTLINASCFGMSDGMVISQTSGGTQPWSLTLYSNGKFIPSFRDLSAGSYTMYVEDRNKCIASTSFMVTEPQEIIVESVIQDVICYGNFTGSISLETSGGYQEGFDYQWRDPSSNNSTITDINAGEYYVTITDSHDSKCFKEMKYIVIGPGQAPDVGYTVEKRSRVRNPYGQTATIKDGSIEITRVLFFEVQPIDEETFTLVNEKGEKQLWYWVPPNNYPIFYKLDTGVYYLTTISKTGCDWTSRIYIGLSNNEKFIPWWESFSPPGPNGFGDSKNDVWNLDPVFADNNPEVWIYDKASGALVYHSIGYDQPWNGKWNNEEKWCDQGIYNVVVVFDDGNIRKPIVGPVLLKYENHGGY